MLNVVANVASFLMPSPAGKARAAVKGVEKGAGWVRSAWNNTMDAMRLFLPQEEYALVGNAGVAVKQAAVDAKGGNVYNSAIISTVINGAISTGTAIIGWRMAKNNKPQETATVPKFNDDIIKQKIKGLWSFTKTNPIASSIIAATVVATGYCLVPPITYLATLAKTETDKIISANRTDILGQNVGQGRQGGSSPVNKANCKALIEALQIMPDLAGKDSPAYRLCQDNYPELGF